MWGLLAGLGVVFAAKGANMLAMKRAQVRQGASLQQSLLFTALYSFAQTICILMTPPYRALAISPAAFLFPAAYAALYVLGYVLLMKAYSEGPAAVTNSIWSFNPVVIIVYGVFAWNETLSWYQIVGLVLFLFGLVLFSKSSYSTGGEKKKVTLKWLAITIAGTITIGVASTVTKIFLLAEPGMGRELLVYYPLYATLICGGVALAMSPRETFATVKNLPFLGDTFLAAVTCTAWNWVYVTFLTQFPSAVFLPMFSVASMLGILVFGWAVLKERISKAAIIAAGICLVAIVLLNL